MSPVTRASTQAGVSVSAEAHAELWHSILVPSASRTRGLPGSDNCGLGVDVPRIKYFDNRKQGAQRYEENTAGFLPSRES